VSVTGCNSLSISVSVTSWSRMLDETGRLDQVNNDLSMDVLGLRLTIDMWRWFEECLGSACQCHGLQCPMLRLELGQGID